MPGPAPHRPTPPAGWHAAAETDGAWLLPDQIFDGERLVAGQGLRIADGAAACGLPPAGAPVWRLPGTLTRGFVDLQVNGGGGVLFNTTPTAEGARAIARAHRSTGTAAILPTLITDAAEVMERAGEAALGALGQDGVAGLHLEGPHLSLARKGTHDPRFIRPLDGRTLKLMAHLRAKRLPLMMTLAPEAVAPGQIAHLVGQGVVVALGHSDATAAQVGAALAEGAQTFTHLFNAMSQMQGREPGVVGAAINSKACASIICDGIHVSPDMIALALRARPVPDRMMIVTDAMPTVAGPDAFDLYGRTIRLRDGRLVNADGALAGAHVTMLDSVRFLIERIGIAPEAALRMAVRQPARLMGLDHLARLEGGAVRHLIWIAPDWTECAFILDGAG
jgi:N-acetylglucosamine-6-phosphate deacetylase